MDYQYENLDPEQFQQLCQSLLVGERPNVQCFPVAQPDGGRDAVAYYSRRRTDEFIVFQVKFVRKPSADADSHKWLTEIIEGEAPKIKKLIARGAKEYYLLTNVQGTAHLGSGSIDRVSNILDKTLDVPVHCWWRDDLNRRLDNAWDLKWAFPQIMSGTDMLRSIIESGLSENKDRRTQAIRAYLFGQYDADQYVRFRQIELQIRLLDLFTDVPATPLTHRNGESRPQFGNTLRGMRQRDREIDESVASDIDENNIEFGGFDHIESRNKREQIGAATLLLNQSFQRDFPQIVLEGAPGQGKSTIVQYVCQVHRIKILEKMEDLAHVPEQHKSNSVRIPIKVVLRDFATWLEGKDPFTSNETTPLNWQRSLEAFLAAQIQHDSGGVDFGVADLVAVARLSAILLVLDGLDEVAEISRRKEIVEEISKGVERLKANAASLQVVVTSRPAAFANSPSFSGDDFPYFTLLSIDRYLITAYANKWVKARRLSSREKSEIKRILKAKLDQPHFRELVRNPMQLAIVLTLIHTRGESLPDKRTALYDNYVATFFDREVEKSPIVRDLRDKLIDIQRYIAWILHSEAETKETRGTISDERLKRLVFDYLLSEGENTSLAEDLFTGTVERVGALVSRVQGTYEFEVQPLREYFAARHLYDTAPYSPPGQERKGTLPDRFDAIARNLYWLNVTRFYSGCYSKGELASLVDRLQDLALADGYRYTNHPRSLAAMLLADHVFAQQTKSMHEVEAQIMSGSGLRIFLATRRQHRELGTSLVFRDGPGKEELKTRCMYALHGNWSDYAWEACYLLRENASPVELRDSWFTQALSVSPDERAKWLSYGRVLGILSRVTAEEIESLLPTDAFRPDILAALFGSGHAQICESTESRCEASLDAILTGTIRSAYYQPSTILESFHKALDGTSYALAFQTDEPVPLAHIQQQYIIGSSKTEKAPPLMEPAFSVLQQCVEIVKLSEAEGSRTAKEWATELTSWDNIIEAVRSTWGERVVLFELANIASGIRSSKEPCREFPDFLDHSKSLCRRTRYARLRAGVPNWWEKQIGLASSDLDLFSVLLGLITWGSSHTLVRLIEPIDMVLTRLTETEWHRLATSLRKVLYSARSDIRDQSHFDPSALPDGLSARAVMVLAERAELSTATDLYLKYLPEYTGSDVATLEFCENMAFRLLQGTKAPWRQLLEVIAFAYAKGISMVRIPHFTQEHFSGSALPVIAAQEIIEHAERYPLYLIAFAEAKCQEEITSRIVPVAEVAKAEGWFDAN